MRLRAFVQSGKFAMIMIPVLRYEGSPRMTNC